MDQRSSLSLAQILLRFFAGFGAGFAGAIVLGIVILLSWSIVGGTLAPPDTAFNEFGVRIDQMPTHPLFLHVVTLAVFLGAIVANVGYVFLSTALEKRYDHRATVITHTFFGNLILLVLILPVYMIMSRSFGSSGIGLAGIIHVMLATLFTFFVLEIINQSKYLLVNVYGAIIGLVFFFFFAIWLAGNNPTVLAFLTLPLLVGFIALGNGIAESLYNWIYRIYGSDFLNIETRFGTDYGKKDEISPEDLDV